MSENKIGKGFCVLPWVGLHVMPDSNVTPCCVSHYDNPYGNVSKESIQDIWNGPKFKALRASMLRGEMPEVCSYCHKMEESGFVSLRQSMNTRLHSEIKKIVFLSEQDGFAKLELKALDIRFSNICNFKCRSCSPTLSSSWFEDFVALGKIEATSPKVKSIKVDSPDFWEEFHSLISGVEYIYFGGGEPLITREHFDLLKMLIDKGQTNIDLVYNTNLSTLKYDNNNLTDLWKHFRTVEIGVSIDDMGARADYARHGSRWTTVVSNLKTLGQQNPGIRVYVNCTVGLMNVYYLPELYEFILSEKLVNTNKINVNMIQLPWELCVTALPQKAKEIVAHKLLSYVQKLESKNIFTYSRDIKNIIKEMMNEAHPRHFQEFISYTKNVDLLRDEDFSKTYPELSDILFG